MTIEVRPQFNGPANPNSQKQVVTSLSNGKLDQSKTAVEQRNAKPDWDEMISEFKNSNQNFLDLKAMIDEAKKKGNKEFGMDVVQIAQKIQNQRDLVLNVNKKDYIGNHKTSIKNWQNVMLEEKNNR